MGCSVGKINPDEIDLSHFKIETIIGQGGFGKVNCVTKRCDNKMYAMKTMRKSECFKRSSGPDQIFQEMIILAQMDYVFICNSHHAFQDEYNLYMVMDLGLGGDLRYQQGFKFKDKVFPEKLAKFYTAQLVLALDYMHNQNILHRDIKPDNMILRENGYILLTDMGISQKIESPTSFVNNRSGTHGFMAPEIYTGKSNVLSEWFSVGVCIHYFCTGQNPYKTAKDMPANGKLRMLEKAKPALSSNFKDLCAGLLQKDPNQRLGSKEPGTAVGIKDHLWFDDMDFEALESLQVPPPYLPDCRHANCNTGENNLLEQFEVEKPVMPTPEQQEKFKNYRYNLDIGAIKDIGVQSKSSQN